MTKKKGQLSLFVGISVLFSLFSHSSEASISFHWNNPEPLLFFQFPKDLSETQIAMDSSESLKFETLSANDCRKLFGQGGAFPNLTSLRIEQFEIDLECANFFPENLERLDLVNVKIVKKDTSQTLSISSIDFFLLQIAAKLQKLRFLNLSRTNLKPESLVHFAVGLSCLPRLEYLVLDHNSLEDECAFILSVVLSRFYFLKGLRIENNQLTYKGAYSILTSFFSGQQGVQLYLKDNPIEKEKMAYLLHLTHNQYSSNFFDYSF